MIFAYRLKTVCSFVCSGMLVSGLVPLFGEESPASTDSPGSPVVASQAVVLGGLDVRQFGALGNGVADDTAAIRAAIAKAQKTGGGEVVFPAGRYRVSESIAIPTGTQLRGVSKTGSRLIAPTGVLFDLFTLDDVQDVTIRDLGIIEEAAAEGKSRGCAIAINGKSRFITIENVFVEGFQRGFSIGRAEMGIASNIVYRNCRTESSRSYGFDVNQCREVLLDSCYAYHHYLDGIKLRKATRDVTIRGGEASYNGMSRLKDPKLNGNGVDAYAGGDAFLIDGLVTEYNQGSGLYMKTGRYQEKEGDIIGNAMVTNVRSRYNIGSGLDINRSGGDTVSDPLLANVTVLGGVFEENTSCGIYVRGRNIAIMAPIIRANASHGIDLASAFDVTVNGALISANSQKEPGVGHGISIGSGPLGGHRIHISGGVINGIGMKPNQITAGDDFSGEQPSHGKAVLISERSSDVKLEGITYLNWSKGGEPVDDRSPKKGEKSGND